MNRGFFCLALLTALSSSCKNVSAHRRALGPVAAGIDVLEADNFRELRGEKIGLITNMSARDLLGRPTASVLARAPGVDLVRIFSVEHGLWALSESSQIVSGVFSVDGRNIPVISLYGGGLESMRPRPEDLSGLDALVFDCPDVGARFYTYLTTMALALEASSKASVGFVVLDRPNPITGSIVEGPIADAATLKLSAPTAYLPVPVRHGLTAGETALFINRRIQNKSLRVVKMRGWKRKMWFDQTGLLWFAPSPNMPDLSAATLYPGIGIFEASNISVGRGTPWPFGWIGAPWMNSEKIAARLKALKIPGVEFSAQDARPEKSVFAGRTCRGLRIKIVDREKLRPLSAFAAINAELTRANPKKFLWRWKQLRLMVGTEKFRRLLRRKADLKTIEAFFDSQAALFKKLREPYLLYH